MSKKECIDCSSTVYPYHFKFCSIKDAGWKDIEEDKEKSAERG